LGLEDPAQLEVTGSIHGKQHIRISGSAKGVACENGTIGLNELRKELMACKDGAWSPIALSRKYTEFGNWTTATERVSTADCARNYMGISAGYHHRDEDTQKNLAPPISLRYHGADGRTSARLISDIPGYRVTVLCEQQAPS
jgi:hypothetical protein